MKEAFSDIKRLVIEFILQNKALNQCMFDDQSHFSNNDFTSLEQSDLNKAAIQATLSDVMSQLDNHPAITINYGDLFVKLSYYAGTLSSVDQTTLLDLIQNMREEYTTGLRLVLINRQVVNANLGYIKEVISQLTQTPKQLNSTTYDQTGVLA